MGNVAHGSAGINPHAALHESGGADEIDVTTLGGYPSDSGKVLLGDGTWGDAPSAAEAGVITVTQASHGFAAKDVIRRDSGGSYVKAQADSAENCEACGIVGSVDGNDFVYYTPGSVITGLSSLTDAGTYFLSADTAGLLTLTEPTTGYRKPMARALSTASLEVIDHPAVEIAESPTAAINYLDFAEGSAPATPGSGIDRIYFKTDGKPYYMDDEGNEVCLMAPSLVWKTQTFTSSGTWELPAALYGGAVFVRMIGGGGAGGGGVSNAGWAGGGGGSGSYIERWVPVSDDVTVTIGNGGAGSSGNDGGSGGDTSFGASYIAKGGSGGQVGCGGKSSGGSGGQNGGDGIYNYSSGCGGGSAFGPGGFCRVSGAGGAGFSASSNTGAGGGGGYYAGSTCAGGNGGSGVCIVEWQEEA